MSWLFLHGVNNVPGIWQPIIDRLEVDAIAPLLPMLESIEEIGDSIAALIDEPVIVVGHSLGGIVGLDLVARHPECVRDIALINSTTSADTPELAAMRLTNAERARNGEYEVLTEGATKRAYHPDSLDRADVMAQREKDLAGYGAQRFATHQIALSKREDRSKALWDFKGRKLVIASADDLVISYESQVAMADNCGAEFVTILDAGHMVPAENPQAIADALRNWR